MSPTFLRARVPLVLVLAFALVAAACSGNQDDAESGKDDGAENTAGAPTCLSKADLYALLGPESEGFGNWHDAQDLAVELGSETELPDLELTITGPGEESGTWGSLNEIVLEKIGVDERGLEKDAAITRPDYNTSGDDNVIIEGVAGEVGSLGWVGFAFAEENDDKVREIAVQDDAGTCIEPTAETIASGEYPISRPLFIYVNTKKAQENPAVAGFVDLYMGDEGRNFAGEAGYIDLDENAWTAQQSAWEDEAIAAPSGEVEGQVIVSGSSTVEPISRIVAEQYAGANPGVEIDVTGPGTSDGFEKFCAGETDVSDASRAIKGEEEQLCKDAGIEYVELQIGIDGLSIITKK